MRLDAHQFFTPEHIPEHLAPILQRNRFDGSIAVARTAEETERFLELAERHEFIRGVVGAGPPQDRPHPKLVAEAWCGEVTARLPIEVGSAPLAIELAGRFAEARIVIVHLGHPPLTGEDASGWARGLERAAQFPRIFCKASGLVSMVPKPWNAGAVRPFVQHALRVFGPRRVMFGSDWPAGLPDTIWKEALALFTQSIGAQTLETREELLGGTAQRFYGIPMVSQ